MEPQDKVNIIPVTVRIFGKEYPVACPEGAEQGLINSAKRVDQEMRRLREGGKVVGTDRIAVMIALNLAHELSLTQQNRPDDTVDEHSIQRLEQMHKAIDDALAKYEVNDLETGHPQP